MPRPRVHHVRRRASVRVDTDSGHSDTISPEVKSWGSRRLGMSRPRNRPTRPRPRYQVSQTEDDEDEMVFTPIKRRAPKTGNVQNDESSHRMFQASEDHPGDYSIRRSTRQRKLKYDNYNDSWIVGSQTVKGYPCYVNTSHSRRERLSRRVVKALPTMPPTDEDGEEEIEDHDTKEEQQRRIQKKPRNKDESNLSCGMRMRRTRRVSQRVRDEIEGETSEDDMELEESKEEPPRKMICNRKSEQSMMHRRTRRSSQRREQEEDEEVEEDSSEEIDEVTKDHRLKRNRRPPQRLHQEDEEEPKRPRRITPRKKTSLDQAENSGKEDKGSKPKDDEKTEDDGNESNTSSVTTENKKSGSVQDQSFQDMYARVKQRRRNNTTRTTGTGSGEDSRHQIPTPNKSDSDSSSGELSDRMVDRRMRRQAQDRKTYHLRQVKPAVNRFQVSQPKIREVLDVVRRKRPPRRRRWSSSSSSDSSREDRFDRKKSKAKSSKSMALAGTTGSTSKPETTGLLADVDPLALDTSIRFSNVGGLESHIDCLKEMVVFPMLYKEIFEKFNVTPPKGVLFHGPPGTGKTLMARALANECSQGTRKVSFFMRKGADCLSKWVGESERQLRLLFEEAKQARPSIIFFDELDGLAPVRSSKQDQIHASIVCTLLALMDGLDNRGDIIVIGATNRIDSIDPALRRPGRFDRELFFPLPGLKERREILGIHANDWSDDITLNKMAEESWGFCGSDLKALCSEAILQAMKRIFPQIYHSSQKLQLDPEKVKVEGIDFMRAKHGIVPASKRGICCMSRKLPKYLEPLLDQNLNKVYSYIASVFPHNGSALREKVGRNPRVMLIGEKIAIMTLAGALLHKLEHCSVLSISLEAINSEASISPEEAISRVFREVPQRPGAVLWLGNVTLWWDSMSELSQSVFISHIDSLDPTLPVLLLGVSTTTNLPPELKKLFSYFHDEMQSIDKPTDEEKRRFFTRIIKEKPRKPPIIFQKADELEPLPTAPPSPPRPMSKVEEDKVYFEEENTLRELRIFLRQICAKLARNKQFYMFSKPVDINEVPDYLKIIKEPMDLETMMTKIDLHKYTCAQDFLNDIDLLCRNALEYNPDKDPEDKLIRHRACYLRDTAYALIKAEMDSDFEITCKSIRDKRMDRGVQYGTSRFVREFFSDHQMEEEGGTGTGNGDNGGGELMSPTSPTENSSTAPIILNNLVGDEGNSGGGGSSCHTLEHKKRKRRISNWSKGFIKKKKPNPLVTTINNSNLVCCVSEASSEAVLVESTDENTTTTSAVHSTPLQNRNPRLSHPDVCEDNCTVDIILNGEMSSDVEEVPLGCKTLNYSLSLPEHNFHNECNSCGDKVLTVDLTNLEYLLEDVLTLTLNIDSYQSLIDLYVAFDRVVRIYSRRWDRSNLSQNLRLVLERYISMYPMNQHLDSSASDEGVRYASNPGIPKIHAGFSLQRQEGLIQ